MKNYPVPALIMQYIINRYLFTYDFGCLLLSVLQRVRNDSFKFDIKELYRQKLSHYIVLLYSIFVKNKNFSISHFYMKFYHLCNVCGITATINTFVKLSIFLHFSHFKLCITYQFE